MKPPVGPNNGSGTLASCPIFRSPALRSAIAVLGQPGKPSSIGPIPAMANKTPARIQPRAICSTARSTATTSTRCTASTLAAHWSFCVMAPFDSSAIRWAVWDSHNSLISTTSRFKAIPHFNSQGLTPFMNTHRYLCVIAFFVAVGCGKPATPDLPKPNPVHGKVTFAGKPAQNFRVTFHRSGEQPGPALRPLLPPTPPANIICSRIIRATAPRPAITP